MPPSSASNRRPPWANGEGNGPPWAPWARGGEWNPNRRRFMLRFGLLFLLLALLACGAFTFLFWFIALTLSQANVPDSVGFVVRPVGFGIFLIALIVLAFTFRSVRRALAPVGDVIDAAERVAGGDYDARVVERGPREVRGLTRAFNQMTERLQSNDTQRRRMLADVSHELRTPLTVIQGNLEGMLDGVYPMDRAHLEPVLDETRQLARMIQDLRTLALAESGGLHLQQESTDLAILMNETIASFRVQAQTSGVTLVCEPAANLPNVMVDPSRIRQVLENLIANALRYTAQGGEIRVSAVPNDSKTVRVTVQDTGRGIPADELPHVFERFYKARDSGGTGLGLAIAKSLVEAHGGEIFAESAEGQGTRIWFTLAV